MEAGSSSSFGAPTHRQASQVKRSFSRMEAGHRSSQSPLFVRQDSSSVDRETPPLQHNHNPHPHPRIPPFQARYAGDGLDFRRPIRDMNTNHASVIDLTDDDQSIPSAYATPQPDPAAQALQPPAPPPRSHRLPRFGREIIDLSQETSPAEPNSPEVQFLSERPRSPTSRIQERRLTPHPSIQEPERQVLDLTVENNNNDDDDEVVHLRTEERAGINMLAPQGGGRAFGIAELAANLFRRNDNGPQNRNPAGTGWAGFGQLFQWTGVQDHVWGDEDEDGDFAVLHFGPRGGARPVRGGGPFPGQMDYVTIGFGTGLEESTPRPPTPKYSPPPDPGPGFTRSPQEEDVLICPNCKEELGIGNTDQKKQVWVVKACGHVYCGECMNNRKAKGRKGKAKVTDPVLPPPFSSCQAPGCIKPVHKNHVMQIFL